MALMLKAIHSQESLEAAREKAGRVTEQLRAIRLGKAAEWVEQHIDKTLSYYCYPQNRWTRITINNPLERIMREIRRRTRIVRVFP
nr:transposase [Sedimenticola thiotaurini]